ncbi:MULTISPECIES: ribonuclease H [unclassified Microbacterium]|uniref:ribonuclease H family protein n=1 Tax=unclassified Microbacterium TaxID=2609290 RepID=UPI001D610756|nr:MULTISPECIES: ribonuclease H [unclassified Microbacterium]CAH0123268.1 Ribonuclease HI [Microbacterium sp. Bi121]HWK76689.1 ribonuclease H [Microbacterium sp.]
MTITAAADGSALGNPGPNGWAWYIDDDNWAAGGSPHGTNNQGELQAVLELLQATAATGESLLIMCDSKYVIDSITKWMPGWKRRGWRKADGGPVLNRDLMEALDAAMQDRDVKFAWVKGHAGHDLNEAADERANAAAKAYQAKREPNRGPGFALGAAASAPVPVPTSESPSAQPLWAEASSLLDVFDTPDDAAGSAASAIDLHVALTPDEHARLRDRADAQGISLEQALRRLI